MAKLPRTTQKIFGKNAPENQITTFGSIKAGTPVYTQSASQIMNSAFEGGWSEAVEDDYAPYRQDRNAVDTAITQQLGYLFQDGIPEWDSGTTYYKGSVVKVVNGNALTFYKSIADNNTSSVNTTNKWHKMLDINASNQIVSPSINTPTISGGSMSNGTFANPTFSGNVNVPLASQSSSTDSTIAASIGWVNNPATSTNVVHRSGDETIAGTKTFTGNIVSTANNNFWQHNIAKGTNPSSNSNKMLWFEDNTSVSSANSQNCFGFIQQSVFANGGTEIRLAGLKNVENGIQQAALRVIYNSDGKYQLIFQGFNNASETNDSLTAVQGSTTSLVVPTMGWVNNPDTSTNVVHRSGYETIGGTKTFSSQAIFTKSNGIRIAGTNHYYTMRSTGSPNAEGCALLLDNNTSTIAFEAKDSQIIIGSNAILPHSITPATSDNSTRIATTAFVKAQGYASDSNVVKTTGDQNVGGVKTFTSVINQSNGNPSFRQNNTALTKGTAPSSNFTGYPIVYRDTNGANLSWSTYAVSTANLSTTRFHTAKAKAESSAEAYLEVRYSATDGQYGLYFGASNAESGDTNTSLTKSTTSTTDTTIPCMGWVNSRLNNTKGNVTINTATDLTSSISLGSRYTFGASGLLVLTIKVQGQTSPHIEVRMSDTNNASTSSQIVTIFGENGGGAEYFQGPLTFPVKKGNSIYLNKTGTGSASVEGAYLFAWNND